MSEKKYRIICLIHTLEHKGGMQRVAVNLANYWAQTGHTVEIWTLKKSVSFYEINGNIKVNSLVEDLPNGLTQIKALRIFTIIFRFFKAVFSYRTLLKNYKPDIVLIHRGGIQDPFVGFQRFYKTRTLELLHLPFRQERGIFAWYTELAQTLLYKAFQPKKNLVVLNQNTLNEAVKAGWQGVTYIPNAVSFRSPVKSANKENYFLAIARDVPQKGLDILIKGFALVTPDFKDWKLRIIGECVTNPQNNISKLIDDLDLRNQTELLEPVVNVADYYIASSVYVLSSYFEGMPLVLLEAMECGLPILTSNIGGIDDVVSSKCAVKFEPGNHHELASQMKYLIQNPAVRETMAKESVMQIQNFYIEQVNEKWMELFSLTVSNDDHKTHKKIQ